MPVTNHVLLLRVNGIDRTSSLRKDALYVELSLGNKSDVGEFKFKNYEPTEMDSIQLYVNGNVIFGGFVISKSANVLGVKPYTVEWTVECKDWSSVLDRITVNDSYTGVTDKAIIAALASSYLTGFDATTFVNTLDSDLDASFIGISLRDAFDELASRVGANWYIDASKNIRWFNPASPSAATFNIDTHSPNDSTTFDILRNSLKYSVDASSIINRVIINGGTKADGVKLTQTFAGDGTKKNFGTTTQLIDSAWSVQYTDTANQAYTTYGSFIGYAPGDSLVSAGGGYTVIVSSDRKTIYVEGNNGAAVKNATNVTLQYYYKAGINFTKNNLESQGRYSGIFSQSIINKEFSTQEQAEALAEAILTENAYGRQTIQFDITRHGLIPGTLIDVKIPEVGIGNLADTKFLGIENDDLLLLENNDSFLLQSDAVAQTYLIQAVKYTAVVTGLNAFMIVCSVTLGKKVANLIDNLSGVQALRTNSGSRINDGSTTKLSNITSNLGEVAVGRATFTDGGTARYKWGTPNGATGVVLGLEDTGANAYGAFYTYQNGTVQAKIGRLDDLPPLASVTPSGWGIYTQNGYFSGVVVASSFIGGTISTSAPPINSGNPGVIMTASGLEGYGTLGLTFRLSSNPAIRPFFSSGTITDTVYEVATSSVLRTGTAGARVQMDNSGIFAWNASNVLRFSVDAATGRLAATDGTFSGTINASVLNTSTINTTAFNAGTITASSISGGTITGGLFSTTTGAVVLSNLGLKFVNPSSYVSGQATSIDWRHGGTVVGEIGHFANEMLISSGIHNSRVGKIQLSAYNTSTLFSRLTIFKDNIDFAVNGVTCLWIEDGLISPRTHFNPPNNVVSLGRPNSAFKDLHLSDGTDEWRITVNTSGVLVIVKV